MITQPPAHTSPPQLLIEVNDDRLGRLGYLAIDRAVQSRASGGVRFSADVSPAEVASLARAMTYKWALLNVPMGGAKAGIVVTPEQLNCDRNALMEAFGRAIAPLVRQQVYYPGIDLGTTLDDLRAIMRGAGRPLPEQQIDGSRCTGLTVFEAIRQVSRFNGLSLTGLRVGMEGFGKVASVVAELLARAGAKLVAVSTIAGAIVSEEGLDVSRLSSLKGEHGDRLVMHYPGARVMAPEALFGQSVDVLVPGARPWAIRADNVDEVQTRFVVPISNVPITPDAEQTLIARGIMVVPDFLANCGGILASAMLSDGFDLDDAHRVVEGPFAAMVMGILRSACQRGQTVGNTARAVAWQRHLELNGLATVQAGRFEQFQRAWREAGVGGIQRRLAWRIYHYWPGLHETIRRSATDRFAELTFGVTLSQLSRPMAPRPDKEGQKA